MKKSPAFKIVDIFLKLVICLITIAFAAFCFFVGYDMAHWYPTSIDLKMGGIMMVLSFVLFVFSCLVFKKKNFGSLLLIITFALLDYGVFVYDEGFGHEADEFLILYLVTLLFLYCVSKLIERKL